MKFNWKIAEKIGDGFGFNLDLNLNKNVLQLLANRGVSDSEINSFLDPDYNSLFDPFLFVDMKKVVERINFAILNGEKICIYGDYDADGVCSSSLLFLFLKRLGADVFVYIPDRKSEGNGMNIEAIKFINEQHTKLIISVDTGIVAFNEVDFANSLGIDVIITDHHDPIPDKLPNALAIINPKVDSSGYFFDGLAGVGVAFKLCTALANSNDQKDDLFNFLKWNLDIVAIATIADMMPLVSENRIIVKYGMIVLNKTRNIGLQQLLKVCFGEKETNKEITVSDVGFRIGPRLNAAGRMDDAMIAFNLLTTTDVITARRIALDLDLKNTERQNIVSTSVKNFIKENSETIQDKIVIAHHDKWPVGVVGLIATKIRDYYNLPAFAMTTENNNIVGSGRSLNGFDITKAMQDNADLFVKFGGHELACGCSVAFDRYNEFVKTIKNYANERLKDVVFINDLFVDMDISFNDIDFEFYNDLLKLEPYGNGNEEPVFITNGVEVIEFSVFGKNAEHFKMNLKQDKSIFSCFAFSGASELFSKFKVGDRIDVVYKIVLNEWNGMKELRLNLVDYRNGI